MYKLFLFIIIIICLYITPTDAQQIPVYNHNLENPYLINPAAAGANGITTANIVAREQWVGFPKFNPRTQAFNLHSRLPKMNLRFGGKRRRYRSKRTGNVGLGAFFFNDVNGPIKKTGFLGSYAYHLPLNNAQLSFGLSGSIMQLKINEEDLDFKNKNDPFLLQNENFYIADANLGISLLNSDYFLGGAVSDILNSRIRFGGKNDFTEYKKSRKYIAYGGLYYMMRSGILFEPSILFFTLEQFELSSFLGSIQTNINLKFTFNETFWGGLSLRTNNSYVLSVGAHVDLFHFGYSLEIPGNSLLNHSFGSHEIMISLQFGKPDRSLRYLSR